MKIISTLVLLLFIMSVRVFAQDAFIDEASGVRYIVEEVTPAQFPVGLAFTPDGRLFYNEKITGNVRVISKDGDLQLEPVVTLPTNALQERGMLGIAVDPNFEENNYLYVVHTLEGTMRDFPANRLVRFTVDENNQAGEIEELFRLPIENGLLLHNGGNVHFDENGYLFLSIGDYGEAINAQDTSTPQGGIHRFAIADDGTLIPVETNPYGADNSLYAIGLRNAFDFTFDPISGNLFVTESGPNCDDEVNLVLAGFNYGWGEDYECVGRDPISGISLYASPMLTFTPPIAPTGIVVYDHEAIPEWQGNLFVCDWNTGTLRRVVLDETRSRPAEVYEIELGSTSCRIDITVGLDGALYFGTVDAGTGAIMRLHPAS